MQSPSGSGLLLQLKPGFRTIFTLFSQVFHTFFALFFAFSRQSWIFGQTMFSLGKMRRGVKKSAKIVRNLGFSCKKGPRTLGALQFFCTCFTIFAHILHTFFALCSHSLLGKTVLVRKSSQLCLENAKERQKKCENKWEKQKGPRTLAARPFTLYLHFMRT